MKKVKITGKLSLNKQKVSELKESKMNEIKGGYSYAYGCSRREACSRYCYTI